MEHLRSESITIVASSELQIIHSLSKYSINKSHYEIPFCNEYGKTRNIGTACTQITAGKFNTRILSVTIY